MPTHTQEELLNNELAKLLTDRDIPSKAERRERRKRMDVVADVDGLRVVIEAETGFHRKKQAIKDADARLNQGLTTIVFALCYPDSLAQEDVADAVLTWTVRVKSGAPAESWSTGGVGQLVQALRQAPSSLSGADKAAQRLSDGLDAAVQRLGGPTRRRLARALDLPRSEASSKEMGDGYFTAAKRGMLVVATAMLFHHRVHPHLPSDRPKDFDGEWPPESASGCHTVQAYREAWRAILAVDYRPVFETGRVALGALEAQPDIEQAVRNLAAVVVDVAGEVSGLRHDLLGRIFHRVLDTARYDGSYYTSTAAAVLLASLAIREQDVDWSDPNTIAELRICDPSCGTGTLLMAAAERVRDLRRAAGPTDEADEETLALCLVEDVLWGYDINLTGTHMAASTLGMLSPKTQFSRMNIYRVILGMHESQARLGSLDFLEGRAQLANWPTAARQVADEDEEQPGQPPAMDLVIMNPPFTRDSLRHDQFSRHEEQAIKKREKAVFEGQPHKAAARLHSSGGAFTVLGQSLLKTETGALALILPTVVPTAPGNLALRRYLAEQFHIETIVASHDPERIFFSENTSIGEVLLVCRRWTGGPKPPTRVVNLARNPSTPVEALDIAARIARARKSDPGFTVQSVEAERIERGDWYAVNFLSPYLVGMYRTLREEPLFGGRHSVPMSELAEVGPEGRRIRDVYTRSKLPTASGRRALWYHKTDVTTTMGAETDVYIEPKPSGRHLADRYWESRSQLLLPHRLWLPLARVAAVTTPEPAVGSIWTPCRPHDPETLEALCLYLNSSVGILALLGERDNRKPSYPSFSLDALRSIPVPNFAEIDSEARKYLRANFKWLQDLTLRPFPEANEDSVRKQIDDAVTEALGLDAEWVARVRRGLSEEPSVTNRRHGA